MTADWTTEYERRLRRVAGETDDSTQVYVDHDVESWESGTCDLCMGGTETSTTIRIVIDNKYRKTFRGYDAFGELMRALAEVDEP